MEKLNESRKDLNKLRNNKNEFNYSLITDINCNFDWVNQLFLEASETVIDLEKNLSLFKQEEIEVMKKLRSILNEKDYNMNHEEEKGKNIPLNKNIPNSSKRLDICDKKVIKNKTGNTRQKYKLGHLVDYEIENSKYLSKPFKKKNEKIVGYLYSIDIFKKIKYQGEVKEKGINSQINLESNNNLYNNNIENKSEEITKFVENKKSFGILCPFPLSDYFEFPILKPISMREKKYNIEYVNIEFIKKINFSKKDFMEMVRFHHIFFTDMFSYKEIDCPQLERFLDKNSEERKYLIIPIKREKTSNKWIINEKKISQAQDYTNKKIIGESIESLIEKEFCKIGKSTGISREKAEKTIKSNIREKIFYTTYKFQLFDVGEIFYAEESSKIFFQKIAEYHNNRCKTMDIRKRNTDEIISILISKYFANISTENLKISTTSDIILKNVAQVESINKFRKLLETIDNKEIPKAFAYGIPLKTINHFDFSYNNSISLKHCIHSQKKLKKKYDKDASIYSIFPITNLNSYFLSMKEYKLGTKLPTILAKFERYILPYEMCQKYKINLKPEVNKNDISFTFDKLKIFLHATTAPGAMEDYNFESLETLGDSILKFILSLRLFIDFEDDTEGELQKKRTELLKNNRLHEIGLYSEIFKYVMNQPFKVRNWEAPLKREMKQKFEQNVTKKCMADSVEAVIGACFLVERNMNSSLNFMKKLKIIDNSKTKERSQKRSSSIELEYLICVKSVSIELETEKYSLCEKENITFFELYQLNESFNHTSAYISLNDYIPFTHPLIDQDSNKKIINSNINLLQNLINYKFKDTSLLISAFTHPSFKSSIYISNYQRLEFLGDSVLEIYLMIKFFILFEYKLFKSEENEGKKISYIQSNLIKSQNFNCGSLTHAKSLLASNYFLIKLSSMLNLQKFLMISDKNRKEQILSFYNQENIGSILKQKSNEYETDPNNCLKPKIISDIFEALLGAILIDSNLEECFKFLDSIYIPFILYTAIFLDSVKYSPISQFIEMSMKMYQIAPKFTKTEIENKLINVEIWLNDKLFSKGISISEDRAKEIASIEGMKKIKISELN